MSHASALYPDGAVISDADGTFNRQEYYYDFWDMLARTGPRPSLDLLFDPIRAARAAHRARKIPYREYVEKFVAFVRSEKRYLAGIPAAEGERIGRELIKEKGEYTHIFTRELIAASIECGMVSMLISGSPVEVIRPFAARHGIHDFLGTEHEIDAEGRYTGVIKRAWVEEKGSALRHLVDKHRITLSRTVAIGDTRSDIPMLELAAYPICFQPHAELYAEACVRGWPVVVAEKDVVYVHVMGRDRRWEQGTLHDILPHPLAEIVKRRIEAAHGL